MKASSRFASRNEAFDETTLDEPDGAELTILTALRTWLRPHCNARPAVMHWMEVLRKGGLREEGIEHFDLVMRALARVVMRPLDMRCRCATELAADEASLLQTIALLQDNQSQQALNQLGAWLPAPAVSGLLKLVRWFAIDLLEAGLHIRSRQRAVSYLQ